MYVPVLKNRTVEMNVLSKLAPIGVFDNNNVFPLIEVIQDKTRSNNKKTIWADIAELLYNHPQISLMIDFCKSTKLNNTSNAIRNYVTMSTRQSDFCINEIRLLKNYSSQVIPVISYLDENISYDRITYEAYNNRKIFPKLAFRVKAHNFDSVFSHIETLVIENDIVILDIETSSHINPVFKKIYKRISDSRKEKKFISVIINSNRPDSLTNKSMINEEPITQIDNSLKDLYSQNYMNNFDGFGDYACTASSLPSTGGSISPAGIYYSNENNFFVSFKGKAATLSAFPLYIAPGIIESEYWREYSDNHHKKCPGCKEILAIKDGTSNGKNQAKWKMITMLHYIYTMYEFNA